jgi:hypothetical protein
VASSLEGQLAVLRFWATSSLPAVTLRPVAVCSWEPAQEMTTLLEDFGRSRLAVFGSLLSESNNFLAPLADPLTCDLGLHAWLRPQREESYTMWLQWALRQLGDWILIGEVLGLRARPQCGPAPIYVDREVEVAYRDGSGYGRLDLVVGQGSEMFCVLEIKTKVFSDEDLDKQRAYSESSEVSPGAEKVFIAVGAEGYDLRGFRFLPWSEVCIRLRKLATAFAVNRGYLAAALLLAFVGAVEQNLLGLSGASGTDLGALPKTVEHLKRFLESTRNDTKR